MAGTGGWYIDGITDFANVPFSISCWCKYVDDNRAVNFTFFDAGTLTKAFYGLIDFDGEADMYIYDSSRIAASSATLSLGALSGWIHCVLVFAGTADRRVYVNNNKSTNTSSRSLPDCEIFNLSIRGNNLVGDLGIWNTGLTDADVARLYRGIPARFIQPASLIAYNPFIHNDTDPVTGRTDGSNFGTNNSAHPPIIAPIML